MHIILHPSMNYKIVSQRKMKEKEIIIEMLKKIRLRLISIQSRSTNAFTVQAELQIFKGVPCSS